MFFAKGADVETLNRAALYVRANEQTARLVVVHVVDDARAARAVAHRWRADGPAGACRVPFLRATRSRRFLFPFLGIEFSERRTQTRSSGCGSRRPTRPAPTPPQRFNVPAAVPAAVVVRCSGGAVGV